VSLILVDSSIWIDWLRGKSPSQGQRFRKFSDSELARFAICPPIIQEILQGLKPGGDSDIFRDRFLALPCLCPEVHLTLFLEAAELYAHARRKGKTIRSSVDCLIAAIAILNRVPVLHKDRDYDVLSQCSRLETVTLEEL